MTGTMTGTMARKLCGIKFEGLSRAWPQAAARLRRGAIFAVAAVLAACGAKESAAPRSEAAATSAPCAAPAGEVNVYSTRHYDSDLALYEAFTCQSGVKVNLIEAEGDALIERLTQEGAASPADLFITADAGMLWRAQSRGLFRPMTDEATLARVPERFRDPKNEWIGLAKRARVIVFNAEKGLPDGLRDYEDLAKPEFRGMVCARSSSNIYNQSLMASLIANDGAEAAESWARGVVANFARPPQGNDTSLIEAVAAGECRFAIVNSYYVARYRDPSNPEKHAIGKKFELLYPNQKGRGTHVNISGAGVLRHAPNPQNAEKLIAFLLTDQSQAAFARSNNEFPILPNIEPPGLVLTLGIFIEDELPVAEYGANQAAAVMAFDRAGWR